MTEMVCELPVELPGVCCARLAMILIASLTSMYAVAVAVPLLRAELLLSVELLRDSVTLLTGEGVDCDPRLLADDFLVTEFLMLNTGPELPDDALGSSAGGAATATFTSASNADVAV